MFHFFFHSEDSWIFFPGIELSTRQMDDILPLMYFDKTNFG